MVDAQPIVVADQENTSAMATTNLADLTAIFFWLCFSESDLTADDQPIFVADVTDTGASATTIMADLTSIFFLLCPC